MDDKIYASVLKLNRRDCKALDIHDAYSLHKVVYDLFPKQPAGQRDFLYLDQGGGFNERRVLLLSQRPPIPSRHGVIETRVIHENFFKHKKYIFAVRLNPTKRSKDSGKNVPVRGKDLGDTRRLLKEWFLSKTHNYGFQVDPEQLQVEKVGVQTYNKGGKTITHGEAFFKGSLTVLDQKVFKDTFIKGIGRAKSLGFGLLQIIPSS